MSFRALLPLCGACLLLPLSQAAAQTAVLESVPANPLIAVLKMLSALTVVLIFLWLFLRLMRKLQAPALRGDAGLSVVASFPLGHKDRLLIVQVGDEQLLLGVGANQISKLHTLPQALVADQPVASNEFKKNLSAAISRVVPL